METEIWQCFLGSLQGKFISSSLTSFLAHITVSLDYALFPVSVSPVTSEFLVGREWAISVVVSLRGLRERPINILELDRVVTKHPRRHRGLSLLIQPPGQTSWLLLVVAELLLQSEGKPCQGVLKFTTPITTICVILELPQGVDLEPRQSLGMSCLSVSPRQPA